MTSLLRAALVVLAFASPALAQGIGTIDGVEQAYVRWMKEHGVARGARAWPATDLSPSFGLAR